MTPAPCKAIQEPGRTAAPPPSDTHSCSCPAAHHRIPERLSQTWAEGGCCTSVIPRVRDWCLEELLYPEAAQASFSPGTGTEKAWACQPRVTALQSSPACLHVSASQHVFGGAELSCTLPVVTTGGLILNSTMKPVRQM